MGIFRPKESMKKLYRKIYHLFKDKKKRYLYLILIILPFLIAIGVAGFFGYKNVKALLNTGNDVTEVANEYKIENPEYILRDNATQLQLDLFAELKSYYEGTAEEFTDADIATAVCKNFVADFYTWSNKVGQYDVGGMYYVFEPQRKNIYTQARDTFYNRLSDYISEYGVENLIEVESIVSATGTKSSEEYISMEPETEVQESWDEVYNVKVSWTYKANDKFSPSKYATSMSFVVINNAGRFEIVEAH